MVRLPESVSCALRAHAEREYPRECCGALLGRTCGDGWQITEAVPAENISPVATRYEIAPAELVRMAREARRQGLEIAGFYHSHPDGSAGWSATDLAEAHWLEASYVITAVAGGKAGETRSYRLMGTDEEDKHFDAEAIEVVAERDH